MRTIIALTIICLSAQMSIGQTTDPSGIYLTSNERSTNLQVPPKVTNLKEVRRKIKYPISAIDQLEEGIVVMHVFVDEVGRYIAHFPDGEVSPQLIDAVSPYVEQLKFIPAKKNGIATKGWVAVPFRFLLTHN